MFITNYNSLSHFNFVMVNEDTKRYLESLSYCPISYDDNTNKWAFEKTKDILNIVHSKEGGKNG